MVLDAMGNPQTVLLLDQGVASICVHSDTPGAAMLAAVVRDTIAHSGRIPAPFAP